MRRGEAVRWRATVATFLVLGAPSSVALSVPPARCVAPTAVARSGPARDVMETPTEDPMASRSGPAAARAASTEPVTIPVAFHVLAIDQTPEGGWVADEQLAAQLAVLNSAYSGGTGGAPSRFSFVLLSVDRTIKERWFLLVSGSRAERRMKQALRVGGRGTLNVYVADLQGGMLGWSTYPWQARDTIAGDAVMVDLQVLPGGAKAAYDEGDTLVHETGHWMGLFHTFANGCDDPGDSVDDTPAEATPSYGCSEGRDTCTADGTDPVTNFMDYSPDACMFAFTPGQAERMGAAWDTYRG